MGVKVFDLGRVQTAYTGPTPAEIAAAEHAAAVDHLAALLREREFMVSRIASEEAQLAYFVSRQSPDLTAGERLDLVIRTAELSARLDAHRDRLVASDQSIKLARKAV